MTTYTRYFGVEALDDASGEGAFGDNEVATLAQGACDFFHGLETRAHGSGAPSIEELSRAVRGDAAPAR